MTGWNNHGQLGDGTTTDKHTPVSVEGFALSASLATNYAAGQPGSFFSIIGADLTPNTVATIGINGHTLTSTLTTDANGNLAFRLATAHADIGRYFVAVIANPSATTSFTLDPSAPLRAQEGSDPTLDVPGGIALTHSVYLPIVVR